MSLIQWYKLDGNQNDSSGTGRHLQNISATYTTDGKIGGAYSFQSGNRIYSTSGMYFPASVSVSGWGYATDSAPNRMLFSFNSDQTQGPDLYFTSGTICWNIGNGSTSSFKIDGVSVTQPSLNQWHHYVVVNDSHINKALLYIDGVYQGETTYRNVTTTNKGFFIGNYYSGTSYAWRGVIDDLRIYDHQLSTKEIKELQKQKILHYKFDDFQEPTENLYQDGNFDSGSLHPVRSGNWSIQSYQSLGILPPNNSLRGNALRIDETGGQNRYHGRDISITQSSTYTLSTWVWISPDWQGSSVRLYCESQGGTLVGSVPADTNIRGQWQYLSRTGDSSTTTARILQYTFQSTQGYVLYDGIQLEKKDHPTPFTESTRQGIVHDSSGYENNQELQLQSTPKWSNDSVSGSGSYQLKSGNLITTQTTDNLNLQDYTYQFWFKLKTNYTGSFRRFLGRSAAESDRSPGFWVYPSANTIHFQQKLIGGTNATPGDCQIDLDTWYFVTMQCKWDGTTTTLRRCVNGQFNQNTYSQQPIQISAPLIIGNYTDFEIDDLRVYGTFLSDDDILSIYNEKQILDSNGNLYQHEFFEFLPTSANELLIQNPGIKSGVYDIYIDGIDNQPIPIYCDMETDGGGWMLVFTAFPRDTSPYTTSKVGNIPMPTDTTMNKFQDNVIQKLLYNGEKMTRTQWWHTSIEYGTVWADGSLTNRSTQWNLFENPYFWNSVSASPGQRFKRKWGDTDIWTDWITSTSGGCSGAVGGWSNYYEQSCVQSWFAGCEGGPAINHKCQGGIQDRAEKLLIWVR